MDDPSIPLKDFDKRTLPLAVHVVYELGLIFISILITIPIVLIVEWFKRGL